MAPEPLDLPQGTLDLLILKSVALEPLHGWAIAERLHQISSATLLVRQGSLYPALHRLERRGVISEAWGETDTGRQAKYYTLTAAGRAHLRSESARWAAYSRAVTRALAVSSA